MAVPTGACAQAWTDIDDPGPWQPLKGIHYGAEAQVSVSGGGQTPLWLNANKYGLSSLEETNGYLRAHAIRPLATDSIRRVGVGYGLDLVAPYHYTSKVVVQQAFAELRWLHGVLSVGSKQYPMELKNQTLSTGSQTLGINARPVPQVRLALPDYWILPFGRGWLRIKGHVAYGKMTDQNWQHDFTQQQSKYADNVLYHSKAGYLKIGNEDRFYPLSLEMGLEMATTFGGTAYMSDGNGGLTPVTGGTSLKDFWRAFMPGGADVVEEGTVYQNAEGNQLGSWVARLNYDADTWRFALYADKFFEDHSSMLQLDYDGYGTGEEWNVNKKRKYFIYDFKDWLLGGELNFKYNRWVRDIVVEFIYSKYQSGPIYHDHSPGNSVHVAGWDNFYNHYIYTGWQHWGQVIGNPLYRSPINNSNGEIYIENNRFKAWHLGLGGQPAENISYRALATWQVGYGTYEKPYTHRRHDVSFLLEATWRLNKNWQVKGAYAMDFGHLLGENYGGQITVGYEL